MSTMAPGWYPYHDGRRRYWDGTQWDGDFAPGWRTELRGVDEPVRPAPV